MNEYALEWWRQRIHTYFVALAPVRESTLSYILWVMGGVIFHTFHGMHVSWFIQRKSITLKSAIYTVSDWSRVRWLNCLLSCSQWLLFNRFFYRLIPFMWVSCGKIVVRGRGGLGILVCSMQSRPVIVAFIKAKILLCAWSYASSRKVWSLIFDLEDKTQTHCKNALYKKPNNLATCKKRIIFFSSQKSHTLPLLFSLNSEHISHYFTVKPITVPMYVNEDGVFLLRR